MTRLGNPYVIGEAGSCHEGSLAYARELVQIAHGAGCQAVKFQFWSSPLRMQWRRHIAAPAYERQRFDSAWVPTLRADAHQLGLAFMCTVYLPEDVPVVLDWVDHLKISSFESTDGELIRRVHELTPLGKLVFASTGMAYPWETRRLPLRFIRLHCVSAYPTPPEDANLGAIERGQGYSDHTRRVETGMLAVAAGADYLEVHIRRAETSPQCPDYVVSHAPEDLAEYVRGAHLAAMFRGTGIKEPQTSELPSLPYRVIA